MTGPGPRARRSGVSVTFSEAVDVDTTDGTPTIGIELGGPGGTAKTATYESGSGTTELTFGYTLVEADGTHSTMGVTADSLATGGGTIRSSASDVDASLAHVGTASPGSLARGDGPTATFRNVPASHDGSSAFTVEVQFSGTPAGLDAKRDAASVLEVTGGSVTKARQTTGGANPVWEVTVTPGGTGDVTVTVPARACNETHAVCIGGQPLSAAAETTVTGPPIVSVAAATSPVTEGTAAAFTLSRTGAAEDALTVQVAVSETGAVASGTLPTSVTFAAGSATATLSVATEDDAAVESASTVTATVSAGTGYAVSESAGSAAVVVNDNDAALTASFTHAPGTHDGSSAFELRFAFSHEPRGYNWRTVKDRLFTVTGGRIEKASRATPGSNVGWKIRVAPAGNADVTLTARATTDCTAQYAACDAGGRKFDGNLTATVTGPQSRARSLPVVSIAAPATTPVTEGTALAFTLTRTGATDAALTVNVSVTESGATLGASPPTTATFAASSANATLSVPTVDDTTVEAASTVTATVSAGTGYTVAGGASSAQGMVESEDLEPLTATWREIPTEHDGSSAFWAKITFSHALSGYSFRSMEGHLFDVTGGRIVKARRDGQPRNTKWAVQVQPTGNADVVLDARATTDCDAAHAVCDSAGRKFDGALSARIAGPAAFSVADATVEEAEGATLDFIVTLGRARSETTTVRYATSDGTARAGDDYTARSGTLTFGADETSKTVSVTVHEDSHDEGAETMTLTLSNASGGAWIEDATATGTITNSDPMPQAWAVRFGRTIGGHLVDAAGRRFAHDGPSHVTVAGVRLGGQGRAPDSEALYDDPFGRPAWATRQREAEGREITAADFALGSAFHLTNRGDAVDGPVLSAWGHFAAGGFETEEDGVTMDGDVTTGVVGFDAEWAQALTGVMVSLSEGDGSYRLDPGKGEDAGTVDSTMTGVYPYAKFDLSARVSAWALAGAGSGDLTLKREGHVPMPADLSMRMGALGIEGQVLDGSGPSGIGLTLKSDAMWVRMESEDTDELAATEGDVSRVRLALEGNRTFETETGGIFVPSAEIGLRRDAGDAEAGTGLEVGAGLRYAVGAVSIEGRVRTLIAHEASGYDEWGASGAIRVNPSASGRGLSVSVATEWGRSASATERLWSVGNARTLENGAEFDPASRVVMNAGYGFGLGGGLLTPYTEMTFGEEGSRTVRGGAKWQLGADLAVGIEASRTAEGEEPATHAISLQGALRF